MSFAAHTKRPVNNALVAALSAATNHFNSIGQTRPTRTPYFGGATIFFAFKVGKLVGRNAPRQNSFE